MGQGQDTIMNIHISGLDIKNKDNYKSQTDILNKLFPYTDKKKTTLDYTVKYCEKPKWNAFIYSDANTNNFSFINKSIQNEVNKHKDVKDLKEKKNNIKKDGSKNQMIVHFVSELNSENSLLEEFNKPKSRRALNENFPLILFLFKDIDKVNKDYNHSFFDFSYIKCVNLKPIYSEKIKDKENKATKEDLIAVYLKMILYNEYDSYFTERGHKIIDEIDPLSETPKTGIYLPIILVGSPGCGKSTFINVVNERRISRATSSQLPVTSQSAVYDVKIPGNANKENQINDLYLEQEAYVRFIDTPGFDLEKDIDIAKKEIEKIYKNFKEGKERIPVVLYFINPVGRNGTKDEKKETKKLEILQLLKNYKSKIIFVVTHLDEDQIWNNQDSFIQNLKDNNLEDLVEEDESNIIQCQLVGKRAYGIKEIFKKIYNYTNFIEDNNYKQTDKLFETLIEDIKKKANFDEKLELIKTKTNLFNYFETKNDISVYANSKYNKLLISMMCCAALAGLIPAPFCDTPIVLVIICQSIISIGKFYGYVWKNISRQDLLSIYKGKLYENNESNQHEKFYRLNDFFAVVKDLIKNSKILLFLLNIDNCLKMIPGVGTFVGGITGSFIDAGLAFSFCKNAKNYFESKFNSDDGTLFFCTRISEYEAIFRKFKQFENYQLIYPGS